MVLHRGPGHINRIYIRHGTVCLSTLYRFMYRMCIIHVYVYCNARSVSPFVLSAEGRVAPDERGRRTVSSRGGASCVPRRRGAEQLWCGAGRANGGCGPIQGGIGRRCGRGRTRGPQTIACGPPLAAHTAAVAAGARFVRLAGDGGELLGLGLL